jgi:hypothetical protein
VALVTIDVVAIPCCRRLLRFVPVNRGRRLATKACNAYGKAPTVGSRAIRSRMSLPGDPNCAISRGRSQFQPHDGHWGKRV